MWAWLLPHVSSLEKFRINSVFVKQTCKEHCLYLLPAHKNLSHCDHQTQAQKPKGTCYSIDIIIKIQCPLIITDSLHLTAKTPILEKPVYILQGFWRLCHASKCPKMTTSTSLQHSYILLCQKTRWVRWMIELKEKNRTKLLENYWWGLWDKWDVVRA